MCMFTNRDWVGNNATTLLFATLFPVISATLFPLFQVKINPSFKSHKQQKHTQKG